MALSNAHKILIFGIPAVAVVFASAVYPAVALVGAVFVVVVYRYWLSTTNSRVVSVAAGVLGAIFSAAMLMFSATQMAHNGVSGSEFAVLALPLYAALGAVISFTTVAASMELRADDKRGIYPLVLLLCSAGFAVWSLLIAPNQPTVNDGRLSSVDYLPENYCLKGQNSTPKEVKLHKSKGEGLEPYRQDLVYYPVTPAPPGTKDCVQPIKYILYP